MNKFYMIKLIVVLILFFIESMFVISNTYIREQTISEKDLILGKRKEVRWWNTNSSKESKEKGVFVDYYNALPFEYSDSIFYVKLVFKEVYTEWMHWYDTEIDTAMDNVLFYKNSATRKDQQLIAIYDTVKSEFGYTGEIVEDSSCTYLAVPHKYLKRYWDFGKGKDLRGLDNYRITRFKYDVNLSDINMLVGEFPDTIRIPICSTKWYNSVCGSNKKIYFGELVFVRRKDSTQEAELVKVVRKNEPITKVESTQGKINDYEYVDLGLSVKWATHNVGADKPEEVGNHYAWGEKKKKRNYSFDNCKTIPQKPENRWERVRYMEDIGGNEKYDVARAKWGAPWRLPSKEECEELKDKCKWKYTTLDSIEGYKVIGPNGNSIFLPITGSIDDRNYLGKYGIYWTSQPEDNFYAYHLAFSKKGVMVKWGWCYYGIPVRPVFK